MGASPRQSFVGRMKTTRAPPLPNRPRAQPARKQPPGKPTSARAAPGPRPIVALMSPALMACKSGLGSGTQPSARDRNRAGSMPREPADASSSPRGQKRSAPPTNPLSPRSCCARPTLSPTSSPLTAPPTLSTSLPAAVGIRADCASDRAYAATSAHAQPAEGGHSACVRTPPTALPPSTGGTREACTPLERAAAPADTSQRATPRGVGTSGGVMGMSNIGNSCYMNATLQCLAAAQVLVRALRRLAELSTPGVSQLLLPLLTAQWSSPGRLDSSAPLLRRLKSAVAKHAPAFATDDQQDAHEFLCALMELLEREAARQAPTVCAVTTALQFRLQTLLTCSQCAHTTTSSERFTHLSLVLPSEPDSAHDPELAAAIALSLEDSTHVEQPLRTQGLVASFFGKEDRELRCTQCGHERASATLSLLEPPPKLLLLHVKRFENDPIRGEARKLLTEIGIDLQLQLPRHSASKSSSASSQYSSASSQYSLRSLVLHHGGDSTSGHYTALVRLKDDRWAHFDDEQVRLHETSAVVSNVGRKAYLLFCELNKNSSSR